MLICSFTTRLVGYIKLVALLHLSINQYAIYKTYIICQVCLKVKWSLVHALMVLSDLTNFGGFLLGACM